MSTTNFNSKTYSIKTIIEPTHNLTALTQVLDEENAQAVLQLQEELTDNWKKKQIFRTETEMRVSVLNDTRHPTLASKYWQSVREMDAHFGELVRVSFEIKRNIIKKLQLQEKLKKFVEQDDELKIMKIKVDLEENLYIAACLKQEAEDRVREIKLWSKIKNELNDGSFDTQDPNTHQAISLKETLNNRVKALTPYSEPSEIINALGPYQTINRLINEEGKLIGFNKQNKIDDNILSHTTNSIEKKSYYE